MSAVKWADLSARERDALVAERVEGLDVTVKEHAGGVKVAWVSRTGEVEVMLPCYTKAITAAWHVVEGMQERDLCPLINGYAGGPWTVEFWPEVGLDALGVAEAATAPEAICIAALRAVGVEVDAA